MLVGTALVTLVFAAGVVGWRLLGNDDSSPGGDRATWSSIALVDRVSGDVTLVDADGEVIAASPAHGRTASLYAFDGVLSLANSRTLTVLRDPADDNADVLTIEMPDRSEITPIPTSTRTFLALGPSTGGDVLIVDPVDGTFTDVGELASGASPTTPKMFVDTMRTNDTGSMFAIADAANFQTIVVRPDETEPYFLADQPVAVGDDLVATTQTVGLQADISLVDLERSPKATASTQIPAGAIGLMTDDVLTFVSVDGGVFRIEPGDDDTTRLGAVAVPTGALIQRVHPAADGERLVVAGDTFEAVVDLDGRTLFTTTFPSAVDTPPPDPTWSCLAVGGTGGYHSIIDLTTGEQLADLSGVDDVTGTSADGCIVLADRSGTAEVIGADGAVSVGDDVTAVLGPDGHSVVRVGSDGATELVLIDDDFTLGDPVDLSRLAGPNTLISFVPD
jgi:hypothetical protein